MRKLLTDALVIAWMHALRSARPPYGFLLGTLLFPLPLFYLVRFLTPEGVSVGPRLIAGSIVFSVGMSTVSGLTQQLNSDRFTYRLRLIRAYPVHPASYAAGMLLTGTVRAVIGAGILLLFAPLLGVEIRFSAWLLPVAVLTALCLSSLALVIGTWAPNWETGNLLSSLVGIVVVLLSPIYFPISRLPESLQVAARLSPYTYAAEALNGILSGQSGFLSEVAVLAAVTAVSLGIGVAGMRWREV